MKKNILIILSFIFVLGTASAQTIDQKLALVYNAKQIGGEFIIGYLIKGTNLNSAKTLASLNADIVYDTTKLRFTGGTEWLAQFSDSAGYIKRIKSNLSESGKYKSVRIIVTAPFLNDSGYSNNKGYDVENQYAIVVNIHFTILSDSGYTTISIKNITNQAGLFSNPHNQPNTFEVSSITLTEPIIINEPLPVELSSFTSDVISRDVKLNWITASEINNSGFEIQKQYQVSGIRYSEWEEVAFVSGNGTKNTTSNYVFEDKKLNSGKYKYRLKQIDYNGNFEYFELSGIVDVGIPGKFNISQNYPNPFNPATKIDFDLPSDSKVSIKVYDITGREVMTLLNEQKTAGFHTVQLNGINLSSGAYFYKITAGSFTEVKKMLMIK